MKPMVAGLILAAAALAADPGFQTLFNGKNLDGWKLVGGHGPGYVVANGVLVCPADGGGNLFTEKEYANFVLRLEFNLSPGGNNGIGIRAPLGGDAAYQGFEIQVLDDPAPRYKDIQPWQRCGSVYNIFPAKPGALKPAGQWNDYEITANGRQLSVRLNGVTVVNGNLDDVKDSEILKKHPGIARKSGHVGFLGHGTEVRFRNVRIKELP
jgi:hypothetical protein